MRVLLIGDPHVTAEEIPDAQGLVHLVVDVLKKHQPDYVVLLGDLHHNHASVHADVTKFWLDSLKTMSAALPHGHIVALLGNHDMSTVGSGHALLSYCNRTDLPNVIVVDRPKRLGSNVVAIPYCHTAEQLIEACREVGATGSDVVLCHQTFSGSFYENGFFAKDGINPDLVPGAKIISGHIHAAQEFGRVWYVGSPRWRNALDENQDKNIHLLNIEGAELKSITAIPTSPSCRKMVKTKFENGVHVLGPAPSESLVNVSWVVESVGTKEQNEAVLNLVPDGVSFRGFIVQEGEAKVKESDGVLPAWEKWVATASLPNGTGFADVDKVVKERVCKLTQ